jgi:dipeptidyl-peptidase-4
VNFDGSGFKQLTAGDGNHHIEFSPKRDFFIDTWSRADHPPVHELRRSGDGSLVCELEKAEATQLLAAGWTMPERFVAKGRDGKTDIHGVIIKPSNFDPSKKYPVVENIYAGPHSALHRRNSAGCSDITPSPNSASSSCRWTAWARIIAARPSTTCAGRI